jgi:hypothetical protein
VIVPHDRITYAEAQAITGWSHTYLAQKARAGIIRRVGGGSREMFDTWLSREQCESLALEAYRRRRPLPPYWVTMTTAAQMLRLARPNAYQARKSGRLPARQTAMGDWLVRYVDVVALMESKTFRGRQE